MELFDQDGHRKYLNASERERFKAASNEAERHERIFALMLYHTGGRISEILSLRHQDIDLDNGSVRIHTLKRRKKGIYRDIPLPHEFIRSIDDVYGIRAGKKSSEPLWSFSRTTGWRIIQEIMNKASLSGVNATPKGLSHGFAIACIQNKFFYTWANTAWAW